MATFLVRKRENDLFKETERLVNEAGFLKNKTRWTSLFCHLTSSKVNKVKLWKDNFVGWLNPWATLDVQSEDGVGARWSRIQIVLSDRPWELTFEETI